MLTDVMEYFELNRSFRRIGFKDAFESEQYRRVEKELTHSICEGNLIVVSGIMGIGKTTMIRLIKQNLNKGKKIVVCRSLSLEKSKVNLLTLMSAIFSDLVAEKDFKVPSQAEKRERILCDLIGRRKKPVALFVDEAHDLNGNTLGGLKRLIETVQENSKGTLSIILVGHPRLKNSMRRSRMEEVGARTEMIDVQGMQTEERSAYAKWVVNKCKNKKTKATDIITSDALEFLVEKVSTPLQIEQVLELSFAEGFKIGQKPITKEVVESAIAPDLNDIEAKLGRFGYNAKAVADVLNIRPHEARNFINGKLNDSRATELSESLLAAGIPL